MKLIYCFSIIVVIFLPQTSIADCRSDKEDVYCRYSKGDNWCSQKDTKTPYAYDGNCLYPEIKINGDSIRSNIPKFPDESLHIFIKNKCNKNNISEIADWLFFNEGSIYSEYSKAAYSNNINTKIVNSYESSFNCYSNISRNGSVEADYIVSFFINIGIINNDKNKAFKLLKKSSDNGYHNSQYSLGNYYEHGDSEIKIQKNINKALNLYKKSAKQGNRHAQYNIGYIYLTGKDSVKKDYGKALKWLEKSANQGLPIAQYYLARMYSEGYGVKENSEKSDYWYANSANQSDYRALNIYNKRRQSW